MKKNILLTTVSLILIIAAVLGINYLFSLQKASFNLDESTEAIIVYNSSDKEIRRFSSDGNMLLQSGEYYIIPSGENLSSDKITFTIDKDDVTVVVNPAYTEDFLATKLNGEIENIKAAITGKYPSALTDYTLSQGKLYDRGQWYGGLLKPKVNDIREQKDPYRVVLKKENNQWKVIRRPEYTLSSSRYEEVPLSILRKINAIVGEPGN